MILDSRVLAFIGLGLLFWGIIARYITTEEYVKRTLLKGTSQPALKILNEALAELNYNGKAVYLPPSYQANMEANRICITKNENATLPTPEQTQKETRIFVTSSEWILLVPPGNELVQLFEKTLKTSFTKADFNYLIQNLPRALVEELEIADNIKIGTIDNLILLNIGNTVYADFYKEPQLPNSIGNPLTSAIACAIAKATGKPVTIRKDQAAPDQKTIQIEYEVLPLPQEKIEQ
jgi:hypothetical protein